VKVTVKTFADFRELLGKELVLAVPEGATIETLLQMLGIESASFLAEVLESNGQLKPSVNILQNGRNIHSLDETKTVLMEGDVVAIFPPVAGG
jgi:MoaD family protein